MSSCRHFSTQFIDRKNAPKKTKQNGGVEISVVLPEKYSWKCANM